VGSIAEESRRERKVEHDPGPRDTGREMSQQNVEIVLAAGRLFDAQDWAGLSEILQPSVITYWPEDWPETGVFAGRDPVVAHFRRLREDWAQSHLTAEAIVENGDWVAVRWRDVVERRREVLEGAQSSAPGELLISAAYRIEEGRITTIRFSWNHAEALEAAGLSDG
jgi:ketosteroid isomerase-like protein